MQESPEGGHRRFASPYRLVAVVSRKTTCRIAVLALPFTKVKNRAPSPSCGGMPTVGSCILVPIRKTAGLLLHVRSDAKLSRCATPCEGKRR